MSIHNKNFESLMKGERKHFFFAQWTIDTKFKMWRFRSSLGDENVHP